MILHPDTLTAARLAAGLTIDAFAERLTGAGVQAAVKRGEQPALADQLDVFDHWRMVLRLWENGDMPADVPDGSAVFAALLGMPAGSLGVLALPPREALQAAPAGSPLVAFRERDTPRTALGSA